MPTEILYGAAENRDRDEDEEQELDQDRGGGASTARSGPLGDGDDQSEDDEREEARMLASSLKSEAEGAALSAVLCWLAATCDSVCVRCTSRAGAALVKGPVKETDQGTVASNSSNGTSRQLRKMIDKCALLMHFLSRCTCVVAFPRHRPVLPCAES